MSHFGTLSQLSNLGRNLLEYSDFQQYNYFERNSSSNALKSEIWNNKMVKRFDSAPNAVVCHSLELAFQQSPALVTFTQELDWCIQHTCLAISSLRDTQCNLIHSKHSNPWRKKIRHILDSFRRIHMPSKWSTLDSGNLLGLHTMVVGND